VGIEPPLPRHYSRLPALLEVQALTESHVCCTHIGSLSKSSPMPVRVKCSRHIPVRVENSRYLWRAVSPSGICKRLMGPLRRQSLDDLIPRTEKHPRRVPKESVVSLTSIRSRRRPREAGDRLWGRQGTRPKRSEHPCGSRLPHVRFCTNVCTTPPIATVSGSARDSRSRPSIK
jgi:hypothetical protein